MNKKTLRAVMVENGDTQESLARAMGISLSCLNAKINETRGAQFRQTEIDFMRKRYDLSAQDIVKIFFAH